MCISIPSLDLGCTIGGEYEIKHLKQDRQFEHFVNYCVISNIETSREIIEQINVGGDSNPGIDGLAIVVNDHVALTQEEVEYFYDQLKRLDVDLFHPNQNVTKV